MNKTLNLFLCLCFIGVWAGCKKPSEKKDKSLETRNTTEEKQVKNADTEVKYAEGKAIYQQYCVTCHQSTGSGVPNLNPPLLQTKYVLGDKETLIKILLNGSSEGLEVKGQTYSNNMPAFDYLKNQEVADVLSYIRNNFGNKAEAIIASEVQKVREDQ